MTNLGRVGLVTSGVVGAGGLYEFGKAANQMRKAVTHGKEIAKIAPEISQTRLQQIKNNPNISGQTFMGENLGNLAEETINNAKSLNQNLKKSRIGRIQFLGNAWNNLSRAPRIVLLNTGMMANAGANKLKSMPGGLTAQESKLLDHGVKIADHLGMSGLHLKNSKGLMKIAGGVGGLGGLLYINGRSLQNPNSQKNGILTSTKK